MTSSTSYYAVADAGKAGRLAATASPFTIEVRFLGGLTERQQQAFSSAADRWTRMIVGDLPSVVVDGETIDDILILAQGQDIDGTGSILGQAGPTALRPATAGSAALLPAKGLMSFDTADLAQMESAGTLVDVIAHEMGHVLGVGSIWRQKGLLEGASTNNPLFSGPVAMAAYAELLGVPAPRLVPVENTGGPGTRGSHWREAIFRQELMSGFIGSAGNPLSRLTVGSLADLGYQVDLDAAEPYALTDLLGRAETADVSTHVAPIDRGVMLPMIPQVLPAEALAG